MKLSLIVLIAAVTLNCLVTAINGGTDSETLVVPYIDMLLPPLEDKTDSTEVTVENAVTTEKNVNTEEETVSTTTATTTTTTIKPITNDAYNNLPELSIEALLPPLFEAKIEKEESNETTTKRTTTATTTTSVTTTKPTTTRTTTLKPTTTSTYKKSVKVEVPELLLDPFLPPLLDNEIVTKDEVVTSGSSEVEKRLVKTTTKSYYQQQHVKQLAADLQKDLKSINIPKSSDRHTAETKSLPKQVALPKSKLSSNIESLTKQHAAKQVASQQRRKPNNNHSNYNNDKQYNYNFDLYFGSTTPRPKKTGLPTITPFPHRLRR